MNYHYYIEGKMGSKPKSDKRVKKVKSVGKVNSGMKGEQWQEAISQLAKIRKLQNFAAMLSASFLILVFASLFLWFLTCSSEFNSDLL